MKTKNFLATILIFFIFPITTANATIPIANTYNQGIYKISESSKENYTAKLITPNNITSLIIIDPDGDIKFFKRFDTVNETINLGPMVKGDIVSVIGSGEIAANFISIN
ncbi:hypothetical protein [Clostridium beijerinckii]|uniref:hypothetical protein n=1 Tax=Clostridium beijerinckii TaxID=1520 RepID=UPI00047D8E18|nr:hypothetical protein [Clostridium beijerinckii]